MANGNGNGLGNTQAQISVVATPWGMLPTKLVEFFVKDAPYALGMGVLAYLLFAQGQDAKADRQLWREEVGQLREKVAASTLEQTLLRGEFNQLATFLKYQVRYQPPED